MEAIQQVEFTVGLLLVPMKSPFLIVWDVPVLCGPTLHQNQVKQKILKVRFNTLILCVALVVAAVSSPSCFGGFSGYVEGNSTGGSGEYLFSVSRFSFIIIFII